MVRVRGNMCNHDSIKQTILRHMVKGKLYLQTPTHIFHFKLSGVFGFVLTFYFLHGEYKSG